jgi:hypothetical protein
LPPSQTTFFVAAGIVAVTDCVTLYQHWLV